MKYKIAIIGATGVVGQTTLKILEERGLKENEFYLFASSKSAGRKILLSGKEYEVQLLCDENLFKNRYDYALFCTGEEVSSLYVKKLAEKETIVIDYSSLYRKEYPLIVPEINMEKAMGKIICNPNCSTIAGVMSLYEVYKNFGLERIVYTTYQAVSGAGKLALDEIQEENPARLKKLDFVIKNNIIPYIGNIFEDGYSKEEHKMIFESKKILNDFDIKISATCVRVPVDVGHSISINFKTKKKTSLKELEWVLKNTKGVCWHEYPMPIHARGQEDVLVGRLRRDEADDKTFNIFVCSDNLRKGAAQNGVQILEGLIKRR